MDTISSKTLRKGYLGYHKSARYDRTYQIATYLLEHFWGKPAEVADGLGILLLHWNGAFYNNGPFDYKALEKCISSNQKLLNEYRRRDILSYSPKDDAKIKRLFTAFLNGLRICEGKSKGKSTPVGVAKALHLLAPGFFPVWDHDIACAHGCDYSTDPAGNYVSFIRKTKAVAKRLHPCKDVDKTGRTLVKLIDEYLMDYKRRSMV